MAEFWEVMVVVCLVKCKQLQKLIDDELSSAFMVRTGAAGAVEARAGRQRSRRAHVGGGKQEGMSSSGACVGYDGRVYRFI